MATRSVKRATHHRRIYAQLASLTTEQINPASRQIDTADIRTILSIINHEDAKVAAAVKRVLPAVARGVALVVKAFESGGRLLYVGAGTSGRLGILDAAECPPTFGTDPGMVVGIIAGGHHAVFKSQEGVEDSEPKGAAAIRSYRVKQHDVVCGIAASGRTPFVIGALNEARKRGAATLCVSTNTSARLRKMGMHADVTICPNVGPEVVMGSTRMKSGTAQKLVLNMLTTAAMIRLGKTYGNLMIDLQSTNRKLTERSKRIVSMITGLDYHDSAALLKSAEGHVKTALVMHLAGVNRTEATRRIAKAGGFVRGAIGG